MASLQSFLPLIVISANVVQIFPLYLSLLSLLNVLVLEAPSQASLRFLFLFFGQLKSLHHLVEVLLGLLDKDVPENCKNCAQYFFLFNTFVQKVNSYNCSFTSSA